MLKESGGIVHCEGMRGGRVGETPIEVVSIGTLCTVEISVFHDFSYRLDVVIVGVNVNDDDASYQKVPVALQGMRTTHRLRDMTPRAI